MSASIRLSFCVALVCLQIGIVWRLMLFLANFLGPDDCSSSLIHNSKMQRFSTSPAPHVKILWMYWEQGLEHLESLATDPNSKYTADLFCIKAWQTLNPGWDIRVLNRTEAIELAPKYAILTHDTLNRINNVKAANVLRLELLTKYGGVWSDTSNCPFRPLDEFIPQMLAPTGFFTPRLGGGEFAGDLTGKDLERWKDCHAISDDSAEASSATRSNDNWFLAAAQPENIVMETWLNALFERMVYIMTAPTWIAFPYYVAQCTFTQMRILHPVVEEAWQALCRTPQYWVNQNEDGMCYGGEFCFTDICNAVRNNSSFPKERCFFVKKQNDKLLEYVKSPSYMEYVQKRVLAQPSSANTFANA